MDLAHTHSILEVFFVSAQENIGVQELFDHIVGSMIHNEPRFTEASNFIEQPSLDEIDAAQKLSYISASPDVLENISPSKKGGVKL